MTYEEKYKSWLNENEALLEYERSINRDKHDKAMMKLAGLWKLQDENGTRYDIRIQKKV